MKKREKLMEDIWKTYHPKLQVYLKQLFPNTREIEDRVSEILLKVFDQIDRYDSKFALSTWIYRIARNSQIDEIRKITFKSVELLEDTISTDETPEDIFFKDLDQEEVKNIISKLTPEERELIYLYFYEELNYREINEITEVPIGTLKYRMSCSKQKIKSMMLRSGSYEK
ncbi:sigma-70 family RNA polymerase sigma factor [Thiospirochaeta perfilievii]|uniref:Sigma-70 family RNA polymerase sigma factor n=1 Tax=Thiospirochaeta perfilievii TaxID=252967 RepID=A0A5C1QAS4_9SPIO|nr:sigma-70 family RNA polymerase sigma factor [Thiospirochaeta perfilievii]QEN04577.1 sigma-70 family RNA polymerase sigma factor [Thiospirochaeta perfilievii]